MANMAYCRFSNTAHDLNDCYEHMDDGDLSEEEARARLRILRLCKRIADDYESEIEQALQPAPRNKNGGK